MTPELLDNRYNVLSSLGRGGFGETYLAEDTQMPSRRRCVIKQLKSSADKPDIVQLVRDRFSREAAILESVGEHPQIPTLYAYLVRDDRFYLIQEWIEGKTLTQFLNQRGVLSEAEVSLLLQQLLPVLSYVHDRGLIHRDIKPDNIILRQRDGLPVLIDFGAVRETMGTKYNEIGQTTSSIVIGTPGFMPSEQAVGRPVFSSDLYALGLTAIYLLTGRYPQDLPTDPRTGEILWHSHAPNCGPHLRNIIDRTIASHPHDRYLAARDAISALLAPHPMNPVQAPGSFSPHPGSVPLTPSVAFPPTDPPLNSAPIAPSPMTPSRSSPNGLPNGLSNPLPNGSPNGLPNALPNGSPNAAAAPKPPAPPATDATVAVAPVYRPTVPVAPPTRSPSSPARSSVSNPAPASSVSPQSPPAINRPRPEDVAPPSSPVGGLIKFALFAGLAGGVAIAGTHLFDRSSIGAGSMLNADGRATTPRELGAANTPDSFYFLADSAFGTEAYADYANTRVDALKQAGFRQAGWFWMPQYANLFGENVAQVFADRFNSLEQCVKALERYGQTVGDAYCAFASTDPNADRQLINAQTAIAQAAQAAQPVPPKTIQLPDIVPDQLIPNRNSSPDTPPRRSIPNPTNIDPSDLPAVLDNVRGLFDGPSPIETTEKYFQQISRGNYDRSWEMLDPSYQQNPNLHPAGFDSYVEWWSGSVKSVDVLQTQLVSETEDSAQVEVSLRYGMADGREVDGVMLMTWVREGDRWLCVGTD
jgi:serine/threonine-protein kinase